TPSAAATPHRKTVRVVTGSAIASSSARWTAASMCSSRDMASACHSVTGSARRVASRPAEDAELVALRVGQHHPGHRGTLPDVDVPGTHVDEALHLGVLVLGGEVEVQAVLAVLRVRHGDEAQLRLCLVGR